MRNETWAILLSIILSPASFVMGRFTARIDTKAVLKRTKGVPTRLHKSLDAPVDRNNDHAACELVEVTDQQPQSYDLNLVLGKFYCQRGENDKAIDMHRALLDLPGMVDDRREWTLFELARSCQSTNLVDRAK